jgi:single-stranded DNA-binding protein
MNDLTITGYVTARPPLRRVGQKLAPVSTLIVDTDRENKFRTCPVPVQFYGDELSAEAEKCVIGDRVRVECYIQGREWQGHEKWFVDVRAVRLTTLEKTGAEHDAGPGDGTDAAEMPF